LVAAVLEVPIQIQIKKRLAKARPQPSAVSSYLFNFH
jgi:hypothetical protein